MDLGLEGRVAVVTGAASGIGRACARALAGEGARVALLDVDDRARELDGLFVRVDVTVPEQVRAAVETVGDRFGGVDVVVGCAGISGPFGLHVDEIDPADFARVLAVNVTGNFLLVKYCLPMLKRAEAPAIVFLASDAAYVAAPGMVPYNASKGAVAMLTRALAVDLSEHGIRANCVCPSIVDTPMSRGDLRLPDGFDGVGYPVQRPEDVARSVLYLASRASAPVNGAALISDFGYMARSGYPA